MLDCSVCSVSPIFQPDLPFFSWSRCSFFCWGGCLFDILAGNVIPFFLFKNPFFFPFPLICMHLWKQSSCCTSLLSGPPKLVLPVSFPLVLCLLFFWWGGCSMTSQHSTPNRTMESLLNNACKYCRGQRIC